MKAQNDIPIIFIHYGNSEYLPYTLSLAKKTNPNKRVILLGDKDNKHYEKYGIEHYNFEDYFKGPEAEEFDRVYQFIAGSEKRKGHWTNFVFKRWFCIYNFIKDHGIERFWTFDSDNLILKDLTPFEDTFGQYDCTSQCRKSCMNGLVNSIDVVAGYINKINELFSREDYLEKQRAAMEGHPDWAFTEMRAYATYVEEKGINSFHLTMHRDGTIFDECICQADGMETEDYKNGARTIKKLYFKEGSLFEKEKKSGNLLEVQTINMSWVSLLLIEKVYFKGMGKSSLAYYRNLFRRIYTQRILRKIYEIPA